ncbi:MAG TPA: glycosyltransferase family 39 protein [Thermoleophilaceae bacterium]|nr:glycosyltransferase family 39 protein [Thermoleophilaceae bacterium]
MSTFSTAEPRPLSNPLARLRVKRLPAPELIGLLALTAVLNLWSLSRNGWANDYYAAAVRSMSSSWHNFFYGSFDASGIMTVDKPPLALWVQALSARIFGYHSLSVLVPQALMGIASVALVYDLTRRMFGRTAGFVGGLVLALTPITVAISRHNNPDALLVLCCVGALWALVRAIEDGRTRWLVLSGLLVGLGFETKMAVALMVVPGIAAAWLWFAPNGRVRAFKQLLAGGAAMVVAGLAWPVAVWLTPAADRPWISGTSDNSIWSLIWGYNGLGRLDGQMGGPGGGAGGPGGNAGPFGGSAGPLRLFNEALGGQAGWLLGFAVVAIVFVAFASRMRRSDRRAAWVVAVGGAFAATAIAFSFAKGIFHPYYVSLLAPFSAALVGAGAGLIVQGARGARVFGPLAVIAGAASEIAVLDANPGQLTWLKPVLVLVAVTGAAVLANPGTARWRSGALATALAVLMLAPASWAVQTLGHATSGTFPAGGPTTASSFGGPGGMRGGFAGGAPNANGAPPNATGAPPNANGAPPHANGAPPSAGANGGRFGQNNGAVTAALAYAKAHGGGAVAVSSQQGASTSIINSGGDVVAIGGFSGRESQVSIKWFAQQVAAGKIRWVVADSGGGMAGDGRTGSKDVMAAVAQTCRSTTTSAGTIYDCQGHAAQLTQTANRL